MGKITIQSDKTDDLNFIKELARRMGLKATISIPVSEKSKGGSTSIVDYEDTPDGVLESVKQGLDEMKEARAGKRKLRTLDDLLNEG